MQDKKRSATNDNGIRQEELPMKLVFAPDSFKGSLTATEAARLLDASARRVLTDIETRLVPMADGGEGTVDALVTATGGERRTVEITDPMGGKALATYGVLGDGRTAVIEMAQASGLTLVPEDRRDPLKASSYGTGELIRHALDAGFSDLLIGIGGSATNDGGMGMLAALGARFEDADGAYIEPSGAGLARVRRADLTMLDGRLGSAAVTVICDVSNPLLGAQGATYVYGPQKGATGVALQALEEGMRNYATVVGAAVNRDIAAFEGAGAAGGMGAALHGVLGGRLRRGIDAVLDAVRFDEIIADASLVITGEGRLDGQSVRYGKAAAGVLKRCAAQGVPVIALVGCMGEGAEGYYATDEASVMTTINAAMDTAAAMQNAVPLFTNAAERMFRMLKIGMRIGRD